MFGYLLTPEERLFVEELRSNTRDKGAYMKLSGLILEKLKFVYKKTREAPSNLTRQNKVLF